MFKRFLVFFAALFLCGLGIAFLTQADLGTSPISSLPYVLTFILPFSFGVTTFIINMIFLLGQILILKKEFKKTDYLQIIITVFFGFFIDLGMHLAEPFKTNFYPAQILMLVVGSAILGLGVTLEVIADLIYVPGEGLVKAIAYKSGKNFGKLKIAFDASHAVIALLLSVIVLHAVKGLREGTVITAFLVGFFVSIYYKLWLKFQK